MKLLFDLFPVILFFLAYSGAKRVPDASAALVASALTAIGAGEHLDPAQAPILLATAVAIIATFGQVGWVWMRHGKVDKMLWVSLVLIVVFGGATLLLHDETFIKWKPTVLYWLFGLILIGGKLLFHKNLIRSMMGAQLTLPGPVWDKLNMSWAGFFLLMGCLNLFVAFRFSTDVWVNFKLFGGMGLMLLFALGQGLVLARHIEPQQEKE